MNFNVSIPTQIVFGSGTVKELGKHCLRFGKRALVITMPDLIDLGLIDGAIASLKKYGVDYTVCSEIPPEPYADQIDSLKQDIRAANADVIVGIGGGSALDATKALSIIATNPGSIWEYMNMRDKPARQLSNDNLPIIALPTTSGTGAEVTGNSVLKNRSTTQKATIFFPILFPKVSIVDPELTLTLPPRITGMTGFDAFTHALESYLNHLKRSDFSDMTSQQAMKISLAYLPQTIDQPNYLEGREKCAWASVLAGVSLAHSGTTVAHAIAHPIGVRMGLPHGLAVALTTLPVLRHTYKHDEERFAKLAAFLDPKATREMSISEQAEHCVEIVRQHLVRCGLDQTLSENGADETIIDELTDDTVGYMGRGLPQHPVTFDREGIRQIIAEAF